MRIIVLVLAILGAISVPAHAEDDPMEVQRCVWRCLANSRGADDPAYHACVDRMCSDGPAEPRAQAPASRWQDAPVTPKTSRRLQPAIVPGKPFVTEQAPPDYAQPRAQEPSYEPPAAAYGSTGRWTYGYHPVLGRAAYIQLGREAYGLACNDGAGPATYAAAAIRMTPGLVPTATQPMGAVSVFAEPYGFGGAMSMYRSKHGYLQEQGDYCGLPVDQFMQSRALLYIRDKFVSIHAEGNVGVTDIEQDGERVSLASDADLWRLRNPIAIPLTGSSAAIRRLVAECPMLRRQVSEGCDPAEFD
ncbi:hypothetical protein [Hartmannibacter diazotrophicus]|nr:hypothetical protein [Hartmannibacter diazotrophicus]